MRDLVACFSAGVHPPQGRHRHSLAILLGFSPLRECSRSVQAGGALSFHTSSRTPPSPIVAQHTESELSLPLLGLRPAAACAATPESFVIG